MSKTVKRTMYYPTFNPQKNWFECEEKTHERPMTKQENTRVKQYKWLYATILLSMVAFLLTVFFCLIPKATLWDLLLVPIGITYCYLLAKMFDRLFQWEDQIDAFNDYGFNAEILQWEQICQEQNLIAQEWREAHPLEEAIRKAQETKNCNDIATLLRLYQNGDLKQ